METTNTVNGAAVESVYRDTWEVAYSWERYGAAEWRACGAALLGLGYSEVEASAILRSKITRWAADEAGADYGQATAAHLLAFLRNPRNRKETSRAAVAALVAETFGEGL